MLVSFASGVSTKISLFFHTSVRMPWFSTSEGIYQLKPRTYHIVPGRHDGFHIKIAREECDDAIRDNFTVFDQDASKIADYSWIISHFETGADGDLVASTRDNLKEGWESIALDHKGFTNGRKAFLVRVIGYVSCTTGVNWSIFGYISNGEMVPDVITTLLNRSNTGLMAREGSRHLSMPLIKTPVLSARKN